MAERRIRSESDNCRDRQSEGCSVHQPKRGAAGEGSQCNLRDSGRADGLDELGSSFPALDLGAGGSVVQHPGSDAQTGQSADDGAADEDSLGTASGERADGFDSVGTADAMPCPTLLPNLGKCNFFEEARK